MIADQAQRLRQLMQQQQSPRAEVIAVVSGKGGVGKTCLAANLSIALAAAGRRTLLIDADLGLANVDVIMDVDTSLNLAHVVAGRRRLEQVIQPGPGGTHVVCGASGLTQLANLSEFQRQVLISQLAPLETLADIVVLDTGAGIGRDVLSFALAADRVFVVTTPEPTAITDAYAVIKVLGREKPEAKISLLSNMVSTRAEARQVHHRIRRVAQQFLGLTVLDGGWVVSDRCVPAAVRQRRPFVLAYPNCSASRCVMALATRIARDARTAPRSGFLRRVVNWLS